MSSHPVHAHGFVLVRSEPIGNYCGIDREPFEPTIVAREVDPSAPLVKDVEAIWALYPPGWRREAYRLFSEHRLPSTVGDFELLGSHRAARSVLSMIPRRAGTYQVLECRVFEEISAIKAARSLGGRSMGYDVSYPGGDYYSAVMNALHVNPDAELLERFGQHLNRFGLFEKADPLPDFLSAFRTRVLSEAGSEFVVLEVAAPV